MATRVHYTRRLGRGIEGAVTQEQVRAAVDVIHPSFEIIETRGDLVKQIAVALADNGQQRSVVIGAPVRLTPTMALDQITAHVQLNGQEVATGSGSAVLGNPLNSITWLAARIGRACRRAKRWNSADSRVLRNPSRLRPPGR
jgi:2-keto-4-pentenoate hydratase